MNGSELETRYTEYAPSRALARDLVCTWTQTVGTRSAIAQSVYPDTCIDILLVDDAAPFVVGPWTRPFISELAPGTRITAARVRPGSALLFALPTSHLLNASVPLDLVWSRRQAAEIERLQDWPDCDSRRVAMEHALLRALENRTPDREVLAGVRWLASHPQGAGSSS